MLVPDTPFHLGPELDRAVNRMDFFRLFNSLSTNHNFRYFGLAEVLGDEEGFGLQNVHSLHNFPDSWFNKDNRSIFGPGDAVVVQLQRSTAARAIDLSDMELDLAGLEQPASAVVVPLHTISGKRYGLVMCGEADPVKHQRLALIALDAALVFQRYYEVLLSLDSITSLNQRELQIVRWTSEGKTSAEIAIILGLSEHTVNSYIAAVLRKLQVVNRAQMVASALRNGLIS